MKQSNGLFLLAVPAKQEKAAPIPGETWTWTLSLAGSSEMKGEGSSSWNNRSNGSGRERRGNENEEQRLLEQTETIRALFPELWVFYSENSIFGSSNEHCSEKLFQGDRCEKLNGCMVVDGWSTILHTVLSWSWILCAPPGVFSPHSLSRETGHTAHTLSLFSGICGLDNILLLKLSVLLLTFFKQTLSFAVPSWFETWLAHKESTSDSSPLENS